MHACLDQCMHAWDGCRCSHDDVIWCWRNLFKIALQLVYASVHFHFWWLVGVWGEMGCTNECMVAVCLEAGFLHSAFAWWSIVFDTHAFRWRCFDCMRLTSCRIWCQNDASAAQISWKGLPEVRDAHIDACRHFHMLVHMARCTQRKMLHTVLYTGHIVNFLVCYAGIPNMLKAFLWFCEGIQNVSSGVCGVSKFWVIVQLFLARCAAQECWVCKYSASVYLISEFRVCFWLFFIVSFNDTALCLVRSRFLSWTVAQSSILHPFQAVAEELGEGGQGMPFVLASRKDMDHALAVAADRDYSHYTQ